jgi:hypothetical protein
MENRVQPSLIRVSRRHRTAENARDLGDSGKRRVAAPIPCRGWLGLKHVTKTHVMREGTDEWANTLMEEACEHLLAQHDIRTARLFAERLVNDWDTVDGVIRAALSRSIITVYARPFVKNKRNRPGKKSSFRISTLKHAPGFDTDLHEHICALRQTLIAHHDTSVIKARVAHTLISPHDGSRPPLAVQTYGVTRALHGIGQKDVAARYLAHITACEEYLSQATHDALARLHMARVHYPNVSVTTMKSVPIEFETHQDGTYQLPNIEALSNLKPIDPLDSMLPAESYVWLDFVQLFELTNTTYTANGEPLIEVFDREGQAPPVGERGVRGDLDLEE